MWNNCTEADKTRLENMQLVFARLITGAKRGTSHQFIYKELCWPTLEERRNNAQIQLIYQITNGISPDYLCNLCPNTVGQNLEINLRNRRNLKNINARTEKYKRSVLVKGFERWNELDQEKRDIKQYDIFKKNFI